MERRHLALRSRPNSCCAAHLTERYGRNAIPADLTIQDWGVTYDELEPHFDRFEKLCGTSGKAGNLRGQKMRAATFRGPRQNEYPNKPMIMSQAGLIFTEGREEGRLSSVPDAVLQ